MSSLSLQPQHTKMVLGVKSHILAFSLIREKGREERMMGRETRENEKEK